MQQKQVLGISLNVVTFICIRRACGSIGAIDKGEHIHDEIVKKELFNEKLCACQCP